MNPLDTLTQINLTDLTASFGWQNAPRLARALQALFYTTAEKFARQMLAFDALIGATDLPEASRKTLLHFVRDVRVCGAENIPEKNPVLFLSNHPGMTDTLSLFAAINRADLRIIAIDRPFLRSLPNTSAHLFYISEDSTERLHAVKQAATHLRNGGALLTFPAGQIEPDPDVYPGAIDSLSRWTDSAGVFVRFAPATKIVPTLVRSVVWDKAANHPFTKLKKTREEREKLAAALQLLAHVMFNLRPVTVTVQFGKPIGVEAIGSKDVEKIHAAVLAEMRALIQTTPKSGESAIRDV